jgi:hypothetical protein
MADMTIRAWAIADVNTEQVREALKDPSVANLPGGPARILIEQLEHAVNASPTDPPGERAQLVLIDSTF